MQFFPPMRNASSKLRQELISSETHFPYGSHNYFIILRIISNVERALFKPKVPQMIPASTVKKVYIVEKIFTLAQQ